MAKTLENYNKRSGTSHTSSLFHYTREWNTLLSILQEGLYFSYSYDDFGLEFIAIPMICFCDIPLSRNQEHTDRYGDYALGISKDTLIDTLPHGWWGPVNYTLSGSAIMVAKFAREKVAENEEELRSIMDSIKDSTPSETDANLETYLGNLSLSIKDFKAISELEMTIISVRQAISLTLGFIKPFDGLNKEGKRQYNYDECEWRVILPEDIKLTNGNTLKWIYDIEDYKRWRGDSKIKPHVDYPPLRFSIDQLRYIIVKSKEELSECVKDIMEMKTFCGSLIDDDIKAQLCSKLFTQDQLNFDL